ncbi:GTP 3',8-cyclase MoaA [Puniceicoccus vermicola]|uniref:GTP 3',8-cyclase n=1 Tax=Puniceicoccus vermicola TaxID=388746 RepID=A0A7X1B1K8_9BACT|nr:GTP 3',8-cyclase MoaA [Puniceicoccus vermicola]MBC2603931.1 GTP 3',8-cyclase MoaA [Puniceicoccus vermicola]
MSAPLPQESTPPIASVADQRGRLLRDLRLSVIDRCNLRCRYCLPAEVFGEDFRFRNLSELLSFDELTEIASAFLSLGVQKIRLTGGEPLLRPNLPDLIARLRDLDPSLDLALTTNGMRLASMAPDLKKAGLNRVNISLDALDPTVAERMAGRRVHPEHVLEAAEAARSEGLGVKLNTVVQRVWNESEVLPLARMARDRGFPLRFIEFMDVGTQNHWDRKEVVTGAELRDQLTGLSPLKPLPIPFGAVAREYEYTDGRGTVGFIESISAPFCGDCTRARVSAEGELFTCLYSSTGIPLKPFLKSDENFPEKLKSIWRHRNDRYSEIRGQANSPKVHEEMWRLGG